MTNDDAIFARAKPTLGQYFLVAPDKLARLVAAAGIQPGDRVVELGAGAGTVARHLPPCKRLSLVELDAGLADELMRRFPQAEVRQGDALEVMHELACDVLLANLPFAITERLVPVLPTLNFKTAVLSVSPDLVLDQLDSHFAVDKLAILEPDDFRPRPTGPSKLVRLTRIVS